MKDDAISLALEKKTYHAVNLSCRKQVKELVGMKWSEFLKHMRMIVGPKDHWDQYIGVVLFDLLNGISIKKRSDHETH